MAFRLQKSDPTPREARPDDQFQITKKTDVLNRIAAACGDTFTRREAAAAGVDVAFHVRARCLMPLSPGSPEIVPPMPSEIIAELAGAAKSPEALASELMSFILGVTTHPIWTKYRPPENSWQSYRAAIIEHCPAAPVALQIAAERLLPKNDVGFLDLFRELLARTSGQLTPDCAACMAAHVAQIEDSEIRLQWLSRIAAAHPRGFETFRAALHGALTAANQPVERDGWGRILYAMTTG